MKRKLILSCIVCALCIGMCSCDYLAETNPLGLFGFLTTTNKVTESPEDTTPTDTSEQSETTDKATETSADTTAPEKSETESTTPISETAEPTEATKPPETEVTTKKTEATTENKKMSDDEIIQNAQLLGINDSLRGYDADKLRRYVLFSMEPGNSDYSPQAVVTYVNIGLDNPYYTNTDVVGDPDSITVLMNKYHALPDGYQPADLVKLSSSYSAEGVNVYLRDEAAKAFKKLCKAAKADGYNILGRSGFRSYDLQYSIYWNYVNTDGQANADTYSARPGFSEHQTGLSIDVCTPTSVYSYFGNTPEYQWAVDHIHEYGFIIRYTPTGEWKTGYMPEEWHFRYVGKEIATEIYELGITYDEYYYEYLNN